MSGSAPPCYGDYQPGPVAIGRGCSACLCPIKCKTDTTRLRNLKHGPMVVEREPNGLPPHAPGAKLDGEKVMAELTLDGFSRALLAVAEVSTYGAKKYSIGGWQHVDDGQTRYRRAGDRHRLARGHESYDLESGLLHLAHEAWNRLAELELMLRADEAESAVAVPERDPGSVTSPAGRHTGAPDASPEQAATEEIRAAGKPAGDIFWEIRNLVFPETPAWQIIAPSAEEAWAKFVAKRGAAHRPAYEVRFMYRILDDGSLAHAE